MESGKLKMENKYIIKNCPCCQYDNYCIASDELYPKKCENLTDCLLKQIVEKCKPALEDCMCRLANEVLQFMDIEEI